MNVLQLEIITPEKVVYQNEVEMVVVPGLEGNLGILPHHAPLFTKIKPGEIKILIKGKDEYLAVTGGFLDVSGNDKVTILADYAIKSEEIEIKKVEEAKKMAEETMKNKEEKAEFALAEADLRKALLELKVARKGKPGR